VGRAFAALDAADLVLGPAADGGYYLIAARGPLDVFAGIEWSTSSVLAATNARARARGLRVALVERDFDVDTPEDLAELRALLAREDAARAMPATARVLAVPR